MYQALAWVLLLQKCISITLVAWSQIFKQALKIPGDEMHSRDPDSVYREHRGGGWGGGERGDSMLISLCP